MSTRTSSLVGTSNPVPTVTLFPETPRVIYQRNPLVEVICQLRFPSILRIATEAPASFQESIRSRYPFFREERSVNLVPGVPEEIAKVIQSEAQQTTAALRYSFTSEDEKWQAHLTRDFLALTTTDYSRWEDFEGHLTELIKAVLDNYSPGFYTRIGLRYRDVVRPLELGLADWEWKDLLKPEIAGELGSSLVCNAVEVAKRELVLRLPGGGQLKVRHGLVTPNGETVTDPQFLIDADFFINSRTETNDAFGHLKRFNREAGNFFRWCIQEKLHDALRPQSVPRS